MQFSADNKEFLRQYLDLVDKYREFHRAKKNRPFSPLSDTKLQEMEELRNQLLLGRTRAESLVGPIQYRQFGVINTAWNGLSENPFSPISDLGFIHDELISKTGELDSIGASPSDDSKQSIFIKTNPAYWIVRVYHAIYGRIRRLRWSSLYSKTAGVVYLLAALITIVSFFAS